MKLPLPSLFQKKESSEYYLALLLRDEKAVAVILQVLEGKIHVVSKHEEAFSSLLEDMTDEKLLDCLDRAISKAEEVLPPNIETEKTVFGVKDSWVEEKKIKKEYLSRLKKLCDALSLSPIGFMIISEAIANLLQEEEGAPLSGILAEIGKNHVSLTLFRAGKILEQHTGEIKESWVRTVDRLLHHFSIDVLPSRIILFNGGDEEKLSQEFINHQWSKSLPFLHVPQISVLPSGFDGRAIIFGAAEQMGMEVFGSLGDISAKNITEDASLEQETPPHSQHQDHIDEKYEAEEKDNIDDDNKAHTEKTYTADNFGFVLGKDITSVNPHHARSVEHQQTDQKQHEGFNLPVSDDGKHSEKNEDEYEQGRKDITKRSLFPLPLIGLLSPILSSLTNLSSSVFKKNFSLFQKSKFLLIVPLVLIILIGGVIFYLSSLKATVVLSMEPKKIEEEEDITISSESDNDFSQQILAAKEIEVSLEGTASTNATGKKEVGEKAKGTVTIYNSNISKGISLSKGTSIASPNDLVFVLDESVTLASASGDASQIKSSTAKVSVTAKDIGKEYNLPSGTKFSVGNEPTTMVIAKNDSAFQGGSKEEVTVVSKKDADKLSQELPKSLEGKAKEALETKVGKDEALLPEFTSTQLSKKSFDADVGEETKKVTLKGTVVFTTLVYQTSDLKQLAESALKGKYSQDLAISEKGITASLDNITIEKDVISAKMTMQAGLLPKISTDTIAENIQGKSVDDALSYLKSSVPQMRDARVELRPHIPLIPQILPRSKDSITISVQTNE